MKTKIDNSRRKLTLQKQEALLGWLFIAPALIGFSIFTFGSMLYSLFLSFTDYNLMAKPNMVGFSNYIKAFKEDQYFYPYFSNTLFFVVTLVPIVLVFSLALALLINKKNWCNDKVLPCCPIPAINNFYSSNKHGMDLDFQS